MKPYEYIDVLAVAKENGYKVLTYIEAARVMRRPVEYLFSCDPSGFVFWSNREKQFIICYNNALPVEEAAATILHEIAHIIFGHVRAADQQETVYEFNPAAGKSIIEMEADLFAYGVLRLFSKTDKKITPIVCKQ